MAKTTVKSTKKAAQKSNHTADNKKTLKPIKKILISQPKPSSDKSPYYDLARKYDLEIDFHQFINVQGLSYKEFRKQIIDISEYSAVIMLSRNAVDHFFRMCDELKYKVPSDLRYFCVAETVALYLQKFIVYRKRKVFYSADGSPEGLMEVIDKFKTKDRFIMPVSENTKNDISPFLKEQNINFTEAVMYRTIPNDLKSFANKTYDIILLFSPFGVEALDQELPEIKKKKIMIGTFGSTTSEATKNAGYNLVIEAPTPQAPSMVTALENYIKLNNH